MKPVASKTFTSELIKEVESTMDLYEMEGDAGRLYIEWEVPDLDEFEEIGIWVEMVDGKRTLRDYDGVFSLPEQAIELLESHGIVVPEEFQ